MENLFTDIDILSYGIRHNNVLTKMQILFENMIKPTEERVAAKLKQELSKEFEETRQVNYHIATFNFYIFLYIFVVIWSHLSDPCKRFQAKRFRLLYLFQVTSKR